MNISITKIAAIVIVIILLVLFFINIISKPVYNFESLPKVQGLNGTRVF